MTILLLLLLLLLLKVSFPNNNLSIKDGTLFVLITIYNYILIIYLLALPW